MTERVFSNDEKTEYKDTLRQHLQQQKLTEKQRKYWQRKPYDLGKIKQESTEEKQKSL